MKILIIDDDSQNREILRLRLENAGFDVTEAIDGDKGVDAAINTAFDAIILDVMMPKRDGWDVCKTLKGNPRTKDVPVIMLTARAKDIDQLRGFESGADEYLTKPVDHQVLLRLLVRLTNKEENGKQLP
jgi:DNA-binding response OmpR family regulator